MARKKKQEDVIVEIPPKEYTEQELEEACFIPFENGYIQDAPVTMKGDEIGTVPTVTVEVEKEAVPSPYVVPDKQLMDFAVKISHAEDEIKHCNLYMWAGLDWANGRIYEMSRKEWANYIIEMSEWRKNDFKGIEPEMPSEVKDE